MKIQKPRKRAGDLTAHEIAELWKRLKLTPPGPIQTVEQSRAAKKRVNRRDMSEVLKVGSRA